ncbi:Homeodomain-like DNA binding domain-containing transcription factor [Mucor lusitanicus CBS 277.49]|uniref:Homeodomain-like DNA binding domain-containing transcription factor n=1 Tax=Mucor lusitanicus CBS 277.49 TaxID=747725 RepID=A0A168NPC6_MUCCL|nr:Homeodomain-like DNA binding domain-containing transcription factor [Mucor lusitanicus CBS 277.49]
MESVRCPHLTQKELGEWAQKEFNLHHSVKQKTISNIMNAKSKVIEAYEEGIMKGKTSSRLLTIPDLNNDMLEYVQDMAAKHIPINRPTAKAYARVLAASKYRMNEMRRDKRLRFSDRWLTDLLNRIGVKTRYLYGESHPLVIGKRKTPRAATKKPALYRKTTNIGQSHYVEYHASPSAWMTTEIFRKYIKRLNAFSVYAKRKVALLVDNNASMHKLKEEFSNIKLIFLFANTTSKLQTLDADLDLVEEYRIDEVDAFFFLADARIKTIELEDAIPTSELPLEDGLVTRLNQIILDLRGNRNDDGTPLVEDVEGLYLNADETDEIVFPPSFAKSDKTNDRTEESQVLEVEEDDPETSNVDLKEIAEKLKHATKLSCIILFQRMTKIRPC